MIKVRELGQLTVLQAAAQIGSVLTINIFKCVNEDADGLVVEAVLQSVGMRTHAPVVSAGW